MLMAQRLLLALLALTLTATASWSARFDDVKVELKTLRGGVHMITGAGGNIGVLTGPDGLLLVDDQFVPLAEKIQAVIAKADPKHGATAPHYVLNTHWHADHTSGNVHFGPRAEVVAHHNVRERLSKIQRLPRKTYQPLPKTALPDVTYQSDMAIHFNGETIRLRHYPNAHTDGDSVVFFVNAQVVHMGDIFFEGRFPFVDLESGGSIQGVIAAIEDVLKRAPKEAIVIPGHGPASNIAGLERYLGMLKETVGLIRSRIAEGASEDDAVNAGLPKKYGWLSWEFISTEKYVRALYRSLVEAPETLR